MASAGEVRFDGWTLRPATGELLRDGVKVRLPVQPLRLLEELLAHPGEVVTREQLIARLWPRGVVDYDTALNTAVRRLRTALGDHADTPRYIETLPKRGYRFIGTVETPAAAPTLAQPPAVTEPGDSVSRPRTRIAARPVQPSRWVALALAGLSVLALASWSWSRVQRGESGDAVARPAAQIPSAAQQRFQQGRFLLQRRDAGDVARARQRFEEARRLHPGYAQAWSGIASAWFLDTVEGRVERRIGWEHVRAAATRALELDPGVAEAHVRLAGYARVHGDATRAEEHLRRAMAAGPDDPLVLSVAAGLAFDRGAMDEAVDLQRRAAEADPLAVATRHNFAMMLFVAGRYDEARAELLALREIGPAMQPAFDGVLAQTMILAGDYAGALEFAANIADEPTRLQVRALALYGMGRRAESDAALQALAEKARDGRAVLLAEAHAFRGETTAAFERLDEVAASDMSSCVGGRCWPPEWLVWLPLLQPLRDDGRWSTWTDELLARQSG